MKKHIIEVDGKEYILVLRGNDLFLFQSKDGKLERVSLEDTNNKEELIHNSLKAILLEIEEDVQKKLKQGLYSNIDDIMGEIKTRVGNINMSQLDGIVNSVNFENYEEYKTMIKHIANQWKEMDTAQKQQMVEDQLNIDLRTLFTEYGIKEYEIGPSKSVITYEKDGVVHTLINTDPNTTIYDVVFNNLELEKIKTREELDAEIKRIIELESTHKYQQNRTEEMENLEDYEKQIAEYLQQEHGYTNIKGITPNDSSVIDGGWIVELNDGQKVPIFVTKNDNGTLSVTFGKEKQVNSAEEPNAENKELDADSKAIEEQINSKTNEEQIFDIYKRFICEAQELTEEDKNVIEFYNENEEEFYKLPLDARELCQEILNTYNEMQMQYENSTGGMQDTKAKQKKLEPPKSTPTPNKTEEGGMVYVGIVTFLSGVITGIFVYLFYRMFS